MSERRTQNSILFLTTLGVYLGLVLVGATPVLGHAATTRNFELLDEIEFKDDLDKKPNDDAKELARSIDRYLREVRSFVSDLEGLNRIGKFDPGFDKFKTERTVFAPCPETGTLKSQELTVDIDRWLVPAITDAKAKTEGWTSLSDCLPVELFKEANRSEAQASVLSLSYDLSELTYQLSTAKASKENAATLHRGLQAALDKYISDEDDELLNVLWKHTQLRTVDNQVLIVTRLPRAALISLLSNDAK